MTERESLFSFASRDALAGLCDRVNDVIEQMHQSNHPQTRGASCPYWPCSWWDEEIEWVELAARLGHVPAFVNAHKGSVKSLHSDTSDHCLLCGWRGAPSDPHDCTGVAK